LALVPAVNYLQAAAIVGLQGVQVRLLTGLRWRIVADDGAEVADGHDGVAGAKTPDELGDVQPQVPVLIAIAKAVIEIEAINVRDDVRHATPHGRR
jgi:hypothetical protein